MMTIVQDPLGAIGDPAMYSRENVKKAERERDQERGVTERLKTIERERLRRMIREEVSRC
jgi:hypothetical protein